MRKLVVTRGIPGSGKSTVLQRAGLKPFSLAMDTLRQIMTAPVLMRDGTFGVSQENNPAVAKQFKALVEDRMKRGELVAIDNTTMAPADIAEWMRLAQFHRYEVAIVDLSPMPYEQAMAQNLSREPLFQVPLAAMERFKALANIPYQAEGATVFRWDGKTDLAQKIQGWLEVPLLDLSSYKAVVHIGDLQGCLTVLTGPGGPLEHGFRDDTAYIFLGDLLDRGPENGELFAWFVREALARSNVFLLWGNHEDHPNRWAQGESPVSPEFRERTLPQLLAHGATREQAKAVCDKALEVLPYTWHGQRVFVCHAGLSTVPERLADISLHQYSRGTGQWSDPVDQQFERYAPEGWIQVHGHRNHGGVPVLATARSFNLEDAVEKGGYLRTVTLDAQGWTPNRYLNVTFVPVRQQLPPKPLPVIDLGQEPPTWMERSSETRMDDATFQAMEAHEGVRSRSSKRAPHILSLNFTKQVFFQSSWDDLLVKARGLFLNSATHEIVARGYEKFFNIGERPETQMSALMENLQWPVTAYVKENGYLGNLGYDAETNRLFLSSKSTPDGEFSDWFQEIFDSTVPEAIQERLRRWLRDNEASMVFEVIDPVRDPHMIDYAQPHLVLLDVFHRSAHPEKLPYDHLKAIGERFGLTVKRRAIQFKNPAQLQGWHRSIEGDLSWRFKHGEDIEGLVLEDQSGFQTKVKLAHYAFWKRMRSAKQRLAGCMAQLEAMADDGVRQERDTVLAALATHKATLKAHPHDSDAHMEARTQLQSLGPKLTQVNAILGGQDRRERVEEELANTLTRDDHPLARAFLTWASDQPAAVIKNQSILELRSAFLAQANPDPALWKTPWTAFSQDDETPEVDIKPSARGPKP